jgi:ABC-type sugar transport system permease subunit
MLTKGGPGYATEIFSLFVYETAFNSGRLGRASAIGVTWMLLLLAFSIVYVRLITGRESAVEQL